MSTTAPHMLPAKQFKSIDIRYSELISRILFFEIVTTYQAEMASARVRETSDLGSFRKMSFPPLFGVCHWSTAQQRPQT